MSNSLIPTNSNAVEGAVNANDFFENLKLLYGTSKPVQEGKASVGDWWDGSDSLGKTVKVTALAYRYVGLAFKNNEFKDKIILAENGEELISRKEFIEFKEKNKDNDLSHGIDILVYLPEKNIYRLLTCTSWAMRNITMFILQNGGNGAVLELSATITVEKGKPKTNWSNSETGEIVKVPNGTEQIEKFNKEIASIEDSEETTTRDV